MAKKHGPNKENLEATRRLFLSIARKEFSTKGYYDTSTADIVEQSKMARGSLYYHFGDKKGLFKAVYEELMHEMSESIQSEMKKASSPWDSMIDTALHVLDLCTENSTRQIIIDVHTALSYTDRIDILKCTLVKDLHEILTKVMAEGFFKGHDITVLSLMIFGLLSEGARSFELAPDISVARQMLGDNFITLMERARG